MSVRTRVENAVIALLAPLHFKAKDGYLRTLRVYAGDLTPSREEEDFQRVTQGNLPGVLVSTGEGTYERLTMGRKADLHFNIELLVGSCNLRSQEDRFRGDGISRDPGIYQILDDIRDRLFQRPLSGRRTETTEPENIGACIARPISEAPVLRSNDRSIWLATYNVHADAIEDKLDILDSEYSLIQSDINFPEGDDDPANPVIEFDTDLQVP